MNDAFSELDAIDRAILNHMQSDFPLTQRPFREIAEAVGIDEDDLLHRLRIMKDKDIIRRIGGNFVPEKVGFTSTLCAARVPPDKIDLFARVVNRYTGVTHNYLRENDYNVWFTFIAPSQEEIDRALEEIAEATGVSDIMNLPATRVYKIRAQFDV